MPCTTDTSSATCGDSPTIQNLWDYARELYQVPGVAATVDMGQIKEHYYRSHARINPTGIVPMGPRIDFAAPHGREALG